MDWSKMPWCLMVQETRLKQKLFSAQSAWVRRSEVDIRTVQRLLCFTIWWLWIRISSTTSVLKTSVGKVLLKLRFHILMVENRYMSTSRSQKLKCRSLHTRCLLLITATYKCFKLAKLNYISFWLVDNRYSNQITYLIDHYSQLNYAILRSNK